MPPLLNMFSLSAPAFKIVFEISIVTDSGGVPE